MEVPEEGLKLVCVGGYINGNPVWRQVGHMRNSSKGGIIIYLDATFNPAGVSRDAYNDSQVAIHAKEYSREELDRREGRKGSRGRSSRTDYNERDPVGFPEDDIPF